MQHYSDLSNYKALRTNHDWDNWYARIVYNSSAVDNHQHENWHKRIAIHCIWMHACPPRKLSHVNYLGRGLAIRFLETQNELSKEFWVNIVPKSSPESNGIWWNPIGITWNRWNLFESRRITGIAYGISESSVESLGILESSGISGWFRIMSIKTSSVGPLGVCLRQPHLHL